MVEPDSRHVAEFNRAALPVFSGIALRRQHDSESHGLLPLERLGLASGGHGVEDVEDVALEQRQHDFGLGVSETGVELYDLDAVGRLHQSSVEHTRKRAAFLHHGFGGAAHYVPVCELLVLTADERKPGVGSHTACIGALVAVEGALVVLGERHRPDSGPVDEAHERKLRAFEIILDHDLALAEGVIHEHALQGPLGLDEIRSYDDSLSGGESVVFEHGREGPRAHIVEGLLVTGKAAVGGCRDVVFLHQLLGKLLAALYSGRGERMSEYLESGRSELIDDSDRQRRFWADHGQVDFMRECELPERGHVGVRYRNAFRLRGYSGVSRSAPYLLHLLRTAQRVHYRMAASAAADYENFFLHIAFCLYILVFRSRAGLGCPSGGGWPPAADSGCRVSGGMSA